jgi:hypothetical protein
MPSTIKTEVNRITTCDETGRNKLFFFSAKDTVIPKQTHLQTLFLTATFYSYSEIVQHERQLQKLASSYVSLPLRQIDSYMEGKRRRLSQRCISQHLPGKNGTPSATIPNGDHLPTESVLVNRRYIYFITSSISAGYGLDWAGSGKG